jgi:hypothetical protein
MPVKTLAIGDGRTFRFGRRRPVARFPRLKLSNYIIRGAEPTPPASIDYSPAAAASLAEMYGNDVLGDCVIACVEHVEGVLTGNANPPPLLFTSAQTTSFYSAACGYVPGNENTDNGCDIQTVLAYWQNNGSPAGSTHRIVGSMSVDATNWTEVQTAIWLFTNVIYGVDLPDAWVNPMPSTSGFIWDVAGAPDPENGHCFPSMAYNATEAMIATWAMTGFITPAAIAEYASPKGHGELYTVLSQDILNTASQLAPNGINWTQLQADFAALGGTVTPPTPPTPTPPTPTPPSTSTPGSAAWLKANVSNTAYAQYVQSLVSVAMEGKR